MDSPSMSNADLKTGFLFLLDLYWKYIFCYSDHNEIICGVILNVEEFLCNYKLPCRCTQSSLVVHFYYDVYQTVKCYLILTNLMLTLVFFETRNSGGCNFKNMVVEVLIWYYEIYLKIINFKIHLKTIFVIKTNSQIISDYMILVTRIQ